MTRTLPLTEKQTAILVGGLLGDLHIQRTPSRTGRCRLRFGHSLKQKEYVDWKYQAFKRVFCEKTKPPFVEINHKKNAVSEYLFYTSYRDEFAKPHSLWYPLITDPDPDVGERFVKRIPLNIAEILTDPFALAVWYLDDGTKRSDTESCRIATQSFTREEHELLRDCLKDNFDIPVKIEDWDTTKSGEITYSLAILSRGGGFKRFKDLIYDIVKAEVPSMLYKL
jgi:hypothetical protein